MNIDDLYEINVTRFAHFSPRPPCAEARPRRCAAPWGMSPPAAAPAAGPGFSPARRDLLPCGARRPQVVEGTLSALIGLARRGCSGGSALSRGAPERVFALPGATAAPLRVRGPAAAAAATVRRALERARPAHGARAPAHVCPLLSPFRRPIRPLLVLAGAGDASEPRRVSGVRLRPAAAGIDVRGGADTPLSHRGACAAERARESVAGGRAPRRARTCPAAAAEAAAMRRSGGDAIRVLTYA